MDLSAQSGLLAAIVSAAVAISVWLRGRALAERSYFIAFSVNLLVHFLAAFFFRSSGLPADKSIWFRVDLIASLLLPVSSLLFFVHFLWKEPRETRPYVRTAYIFSGLFVVFLLTPWSHNKITNAAVVSYVFFVLYICIYLTYCRYRELSSERERTRLRYLLVVMLAAVTFILLGMLPGPLGFLHTWGDLVSVFFLYFLSQSLLKHRLLDIQELLGRGLVIMAVALILSVVFGVLVFAAGGSPEVSLFQTFIASFVLLILFEPLRDKVEGSTNLLFFRERYELRAKLEELRREVANIIELEQMTKVVLDRVYDNMHIGQASIYIQEAGGASYLMIGYRGLEPPDRIDVASHRAFFDQIKKTPKALLVETFECLLAEQGTLDESKPPDHLIHARQVIKTLSHLNAGICIPLVGQQDILGMLNLHDVPGAESYSTEEIDLMMAIGEQAAINIENSIAFEKIRERDRLAVLGEMSAGLAHEIRNPLSAIKGAAQYLDPNAVGEDASEFLKIIIEETDRLNQVVDQFLDYARPFHTQGELTEINNVINQTIRLVTTGLKDKNINLELDLNTELPHVLANGKQLTQVFLNLFTNAIEAMPDGGTLKVATGLRTNEHGSELPIALARTGVEIKISDTGRGIPPEVLSRIFVPFFTTKERGTGLGLPISQRILEHHHGWIRIKTKEGKGSTFKVVLPAAIEAKEAADHQLHPK